MDFFMANSTPAPLPHAARTQSTQAVLDYFAATDITEQAKAFIRLAKICRVAVRPYYLPEEDTVRIQSRREAHADWRSMRMEGTRDARTWQWIEDWLVKFLAGYQGKTQAELIAAAGNDEFRNIGHDCQCDLVDAVRAERAHKRYRPRHVSLATPVETDEGSLTLLDCIGTERQDAPSSWPTSHNSFEESLECVRKTLHAVQANRDELVRLDLLDGLHACLDNAEYFEDDRSTIARLNARMVRSISARRHVSRATAYRYLNKFHGTFVREVRAGNPAVRAIVLELSSTPPTYKKMLGQRSDSEPDVESFQRAQGCAWDDVEKAEAE